MERKVEAAKSVQREFGHCIVDWEIENYVFAAQGMKYELKSASFTVRPQMTAWRMALTTELGLCDDWFVLFSLERMDGDDARPDIALVNMVISIMDQDRKVWNSSPSEYRLRRSECCRTSIPSIHFGKVKEDLHKFKVMTLRCRMIVHEIKDWRYRRYADYLDSESTGLAVDMEQLYTKMKYEDLILKCNNVSRQIPAHKAILAARSKGLKDKLNQGEFPDLDSSKLYYDDMKQVLRYVYTANLGDILDKPSVSMYDCVSFFSLEELQDFYIADEQKLKSTIEVHQTSLTWTIEDFRERSEERMLSRMVSCDSAEMAWQLRLYPRGVEGKDAFMTVVAENMQGKIDGDVWAKVELFHERSWKSMHVVKKGELLELQKFAERECALGKLVNGALEICFEICASTGEVHLIDDQLVNPIPCLLSNDSYSRKLSQDILSLRRDTSYADFTVVSRGKELKAHKCILHARSDLFCDLLHRLKLDKIYVDNVRPDIVEIILDYMYSGVIVASEPNIIDEVYEGALWLRVNYLNEEIKKKF